MKKYLILIILFSMILSCKFPKLVKQDNENYKFINWEGGNFYYVTYIWEGKEFLDAIEIIKEFVNLAQNRNLNEISIGRFPTGNEWQLGILTNGTFDKTEIRGYKVYSMNIPAGIYASMLGKGYPENIFVYWNKLKKWLENDKYMIDSTVFEIYKTAFDENVDIKERIGEIRYKIK